MLDALLFQLVVIGEAVKNLSVRSRAREPDTRWADIAGLRDRIAHEYFRIDTERILQIVDRDIPPLKAAVERLFAEG